MTAPVNPARSEPAGWVDRRGWDDNRTRDPNYHSMIIFLTILVGLAMLGTLGVLFAGMLGLARGGGNPGRSNALMRWRVLLQGVALVLFALLLTLLRHKG